MCKDLFLRTLEPVKKVLHDPALDKSDIHEIILVGGSSCIHVLPWVLFDFSDGKKPNKRVNPDKAVVFGAAAHAAIPSGVVSGKARDCVLLDATPSSLAFLFFFALQ